MKTDAARHQRAGRRSAFAEWLREVAALVLVFPIIDQLVRDEPGGQFNWTVGGGAVVVGLIFLVSGLALIEGSDER